MKLDRKKLREYRENKFCIECGMKEIMDRMKGRYYSYAREVWDEEKQSYDLEKLHELINRMLELWEDYIRNMNNENLDLDCYEGKLFFPNAVKSEADNAALDCYIEERKEILRKYLYLSMRCGLIKGAYSNATGISIKERTDFVFLLARAKEFFRSWCVFEVTDDLENGEKETKKVNFPLEGYDDKYGFHLYSKLQSSYTRQTEQIYHHLQYSDLLRFGMNMEFVSNASANFGLTLTNEGNMKRIDFKLPTALPAFLRDEACESGVKEDMETEQKQPESASSLADEKASTMESPEESNHEVPDDEYDEYEEYDEYDDYEYDDIDYDELLYGKETMAALHEAQMEALTKQENINNFFECLNLEDEEEYIDTCESFAELFQKADSHVIRDFYHDLETIVDLYLLSIDKPILLDADQTLDIYSELKEGPLKKTYLYARGERRGKKG